MSNDERYVYRWVMERLGGKPVSQRFREIVRHAGWEPVPRKEIPPELLEDPVLFADHALHRRDAARAAVDRMWLERRTSDTLPAVLDAFLRNNDYPPLRKFVSLRRARHDIDTGRQVLDALLKSTQPLLPDDIEFLWERLEDQYTPGRVLWGEDRSLAEANEILALLGQPLLTMDECRAAQTSEEDRRLFWTWRKRAHFIDRGYAQ